ncbi:MAG: Divalent metal cation (Fe/Co/Zn/Cd) transporter [Chloroflexi bacterium AL-W]|nr:Divalent metal cation (Fe/Co/Zn/Cd) transporter [Chloroflexi bacterium AL-N1]NOK70409.1 Divalent metal cation (Fe/Co/Zn/Cd) transporter [Chloroflexi bacterium AL-N10]NOK78087.1 Divalent metal cation (Fe/Co/Zn/Cd) transporter [Chloroflexi bacterium AL-N5]NOK85186.1 Divalent metal cation (Fe/Co/Zn/Cd) transporter [Chloroflexi bacterium AL-W]NOK92175.1 Divalent metal cation (Fe/Co/Zn/Cd) transporter [Chloroflexi bacterium AL-N15]
MAHTDRDQAQRHDHDEHTHTDHGHEDHSHQRGFRGILANIFHSHSHAVPQVDRALTGSEQGIRAVKISLIGLLITAFLQVIIVAFSGSVALLADTIHNFSDGLTSIPLWIAFALMRRAPTRRYTYGWGRAEDLAGLFIIAMIAVSAVVAGYQSMIRLADPQPIRNVSWVVAAAIIGFIGNEIVAQYRIRIGKEIGSAALIADGQHSRVDGLTSLAVLFGAMGTLVGWHLADPLIGLVITVAILFILRDSGKQIWERLMDAVDPELVDQIEETAQPIAGVRDVHNVQVRWIGHQLRTEIHIGVDVHLSTVESHTIAEEVRHQLLHKLPTLSEATIHVDPRDDSGQNYHALTTHHATG